MFYFVLLGCIALIFALFAINPMAAVIFIFISAVIVKSFLPKIKGYIGEKRVNKVLLSLGENVHVFHDVYIEKGEGHTTQIDHIVISKTGIFVIETKNYTGWIFGSEKGRNWTQIIYKNREAFYNPILQNRTHVNALKKFLNVNQNVHSIIVFGNAATFKFKETFLTSEVIKVAKLKKVILNYQVPVYSSEEVASFASQLTNLISTTNKKEVKRKHITHIKTIKRPLDNKELKRNQSKPIDKIIDCKSPDRNVVASSISPNKHIVQYKKCTKCGKNLVEKNGKYGKFYGCEDFPICKHTEKFEKVLMR